MWCFEESYQTLLCWLVLRRNPAEPLSHEYSACIVSFGHNRGVEMFCPLVYTMTSDSTWIRCFESMLFRLWEWFGLVYMARSPGSALLPFFGGGFPYSNRLQEIQTGTIPTSLEDLVGLFRLGIPCLWSSPACCGSRLPSPRLFFVQPPFELPCPSWVCCFESALFPMDPFAWQNQGPGNHSLDTKRTAG